MKEALFADNVRPNLNSKPPSCAPRAMASREEFLALQAQIAALQQENAALARAVAVSHGEAPPVPNDPRSRTPQGSAADAAVPALPLAASAGRSAVYSHPALSAAYAPALHPPAEGSADAAGPAPPKVSFGEVRIWTGTWNMGAVDPFLDLNLERNMDAVARQLGPFVPLGYDIYVLGVQEGISDKVFEAVAAYTGTFRLPLHCKLYPAREGHGSVRSRRMGRAISAQSFIDEARAGVHPDPVVTTADMLDRVWGRGDGAMLTPKFTGTAVFVAPVIAPYTRLLGVYKHSFGAAEGSKVRERGEEGGEGAGCACAIPALPPHSLPLPTNPRAASASRSASTGRRSPSSTRTWPRRTRPSAARSSASSSSASARSSAAAASRSMRSSTTWCGWETSTSTSRASRPSTR